MLVQAKQHAYHAQLPSDQVPAAQHPQPTGGERAEDREHCRRFQALSFFFRRSSIRSAGAAVYLARLIEAPFVDPSSRSSAAFFALRRMWE
jgi:hypothetical protein